MFMSRVSQKEQAEKPAPSPDENGQCTFDPNAELESTTRLAETNFADIYLTRIVDAPVMTRGMRPVSTPFAPTQSGLRVLPESLTTDAAKLLAAVEAHYVSTKGHREFKILYDGRIYRCALLAEPGPISSFEGTTWCLRQGSQKAPTFSDLKSPRWLQRDALQLSKMRGLALVAGPFASGKTTTCYSIFDFWVRTSRDFGLTIEDPVEMDLARVSPEEGMVHQIDLAAHAHRNDANSKVSPIKQAIQYARRWAPRYLFLGEIRTPEVAEELLHIAASGPLVVATIHANSCISAIQSLDCFASQAMGPAMAREMIHASLRHVVYQEFKEGKLHQDVGRLFGEDAQAMRRKVADGQFEMLAEDFERQEINRKRGVVLNV